MRESLSTVDFTVGPLCPRASGLRSYITFEVRENLLNLNRKVSVTPMMDCTDEVECCHRIKCLQALEQTRRLYVTSSRVWEDRSVQRVESGGGKRCMGNDAALGRIDSGQLKDRVADVCAWMT